MNGARKVMMGKKNGVKLFRLAKNTVAQEESAKSCDLLMERKKNDENTNFLPTIHTNTRVFALSRRLNNANHSPQDIIA